MIEEQALVHAQIVIPTPPPLRPPRTHAHTYPHTLKAGVHRAESEWGRKEGFWVEATRLWRGERAWVERYVVLGVRSGDVPQYGERDG